MHLVEHRRNQQLLMQTPSASTEARDPAAARRIVEQALAEGRTALTDPEARTVLSAYGIPVVESRTAATPHEAGAAAANFDGPVALKILSRDISHKSDAGGVELGMSGAAAVEAAAASMLARIRVARPDAVIEGFVVEPMVVRPHGQELLAGVAQDPAFGPVVLFGHGGTAVEVLADRCLALPPLDDALAQDMIGRTRVARLLKGYRDRPPVKLDAVCGVLIALGGLAIDLPEVVELDINPLLSDEAGVLALDARIAIKRPDEATPRVAILPYPADLAHPAEIGGERLCIRPVRAQDAPRLIEMVERSTPEDVRFRFCGGMQRLSPSLAARLSQIDYDRQMAFVAEEADGAIAGVGRLIADPEGETAEFALMVRSDRQDHGLGRFLLKAVLAYAQKRGVREVWGDVARENARMLEMCAAFGFTQAAHADLTRARVVKNLAASSKPTVQFGEA
jgi:acetyltransferase